MTAKQIKKISVKHVDNLVSEIEAIDYIMTLDSTSNSALAVLGMKRRALIELYHETSRQVERENDAKHAISLALLNVSDSITRFGYHKNHLACLKSISSVAVHTELVGEMAINVGCWLGAVELQHRDRIDLPNSLMAERFNKEIIDGGVYHIHPSDAEVFKWNNPKYHQMTLEPTSKLDPVVEKRKIEFIGKRLTESHLGKAVYRRSVTVEGCTYILVNADSGTFFECEEWNAISDKAGHDHCVVFMQGPGGVGLQAEGIFHAKSGRVYVQGRDFRTACQFGPEWFASLVVTLKEGDDSHGL